MSASFTPCESSSTVSRSGHLVAEMRARRSSRSACANAIWNSRIVLLPAVTSVADTPVLLSLESASASLTRLPARRTGEVPGVGPGLLDLYVEHGRTIFPRRVPLGDQCRPGAAATRRQVARNVREEDPDDASRDP